MVGWIDCPACGFSNLSSDTTCAKCKNPLYDDSVLELVTVLRQAAQLVEPLSPAQSSEPVILPRAAASVDADIEFITSPSTTLGEYKRKMQAFERLQNVRGRRYYKHTDRVNGLIADGELERAAALLLEIIERLEYVTTIPIPETPSWSAFLGVQLAETQREPTYEPLPPWYYKRLAIVYRKLKRYTDEVAIIGRYLAHPHRIGMRDDEFRQRLAKANDLVSRATPESKAFTEELRRSVKQR